MSLIKVESDVFNITERLKEIDDSYYIMFNTKLMRFELHSSGQPGASFCLAFPFDELDERAVFHARTTRREVADELLRELEEGNERLEKAKVKRLTELLKEKRG